MENKYNIENFERFLREKSDEFRMYPSKRVWYSIYNNMHPGNRLPSISMCIILIFALLLVGYLNTDTSRELSSNLHDSNVVAVTLSNGPLDETAVLTKNIVGANQIQLSNQQLNSRVKHSPGKIASSTVPNRKTGRNLPNNSIAYTAGTDVQETSPGNTSRTVPGINELNEAATKIAIGSVANIEMAEPGSITTAVTQSNRNNFKEVDEATTFVTPYDHHDITAVATNKHVTGMKNIETALLENSTDENTNSPGKNKIADKIDLMPLDNSIKTDETIIIDTGAAKNKVENNNNNLPALSETDKAWIENFALYNRPAPKKWAGKVSWQAYITPSVVYRKLHNNAAGKFPGSNTGNFNNTNVEDVVNNKPSIGLETGIALQYDLLKRVKLKVGVQLNYTRYNAHAFENYHPITTSLAMNSVNYEAVYEVFETTPFSNLAGLTPVRLHNESYQISLPVGADFKMAAFNNIEWYIGGTIQPTIVVYGKSYMISADRRNYAQNKTMLSRFNLNAGLETYISFKTSNYTWQVGPQFRTQIFSTNNKLYSVEERLQNYGFKIGVSKKL